LDPNGKKELMQTYTDQIQKLLKYLSDNKEKITKEDSKKIEEQIEKIKLKLQSVSDSWSPVERKIKSIRKEKDFPYFKLRFRILNEDLQSFQKLSSIFKVNFKRVLLVQVE